MKVSNLFKRRNKQIPQEDLGYNIQDLNKIPKNGRKNAIRLFKEYQEGKVIKPIKPEKNN